jgi:hypothetical protein
VLERIQINKTRDNFITYTFADEHGSIVLQAAIPLTEWKTLQAQLISSYEAYESDEDWSLLDFMTVLADIAKTI